MLLYHLYYIFWVTSSVIETCCNFQQPRSSICQFLVWSIRVWPCCLDCIQGIYSNHYIRIYCWLRFYDIGSTFVNIRIGKCQKYRHLIALSLTLFGYLKRGAWRWKFVSTNHNYSNTHWSHIYADCCMNTGEISENSFNLYIFFFLRMPSVCEYLLELLKTVYM